MIRTAFWAALALVALASPAAAFLDGVSIDVAMRRVETCIASQYGVGDGYHGRRTASGAIFNTYASAPYTVAHRTRRLGSFVTITHLGNGRSIRAKVTDRGPFVRGRCVDLGRAGANALGMGGTARVSVE
jgi:rare lipoprotein A